MIRQLLARLTALTTCAALVLAAMAPAPAAAQSRSEERQSSEDAAGLLLLGLAAAALIAHLNTKNKDDDDDRRTERPAERPDRADRPRQDDRANRDDDSPRIDVPRPDPRALPISCVNRVLSPNGAITPLYIRDCLRRNGIEVNRLPEGCYREIEGRQGNLRRGYATRCLARQGYYSPDLR